MSDASTLPPPRRQAGLRLALFWQGCDGVSGALLCAMAVFSPWAFGGTPGWAILTMNIAGCGLGVLLAVKLFIRWFWNYRPPRWDDLPSNATVVPPGGKSVSESQRGGW